MGSDCRQYANLGTIVLAKNASIVSGEKTYEGGAARGREKRRDRGKKKIEDREERERGVRVKAASFLGVSPQ